MCRIIERTKKPAFVGMVFEFGNAGVLDANLGDKGPVKTHHILKECLNAHPVRYHGDMDLLVLLGQIEILGVVDDVLLDEDCHSTGNLMLAFSIGKDKAHIKIGDALHILDVGEDL